MKGACVLSPSQSTHPRLVLLGGVAGRLPPRPLPRPRFDIVAFDDAFKIGLKSQASLRTEPKRKSSGGTAIFSKATSSNTQNGTALSQTHTHATFLVISVYSNRIAKVRMSSGTMTTGAVTAPLTLRVESVVSSELLAMRRRPPPTSGDSGEKNRVGSTITRVSGRHDGPRLRRRDGAALRDARERPGRSRPA